MARRTCGLAAVLLLVIGGSRAQAACQLLRYAELPVTMSNGRAYVSGSVNGVSALFSADSGAFFSAVSSDAAKAFKLRLEPLPMGMQVRGASGGADFSVGKAREFTLAGFGTVHNVEFLVGGNAFASGVAGIIGQNLLGFSDAEYDFANGVIRLIRPKDCGKDAMLAYWQKGGDVSVLPIREVTPVAPHLIGKITLNGSTIGVLFDTGASRSMLDRRAARRAGIKLDGPEVTPGGVWGGINGRAFETWITRFDTLDIGGETVRNARLRIADAEMPDGTDMVLGVDFFLSHRIYVSQTQHRIWFTYNGGHVFDLRATMAEPQSAGDAPPSAPGASELAAAAAIANTSTSAITGAPAAAAAAAPLRLRLRLRLRLLLRILP